MSAAEDAGIALAVLAVEDSYDAAVAAGEPAGAAIARPVPSAAHDLIPAEPPYPAGERP